MACALTQGYAVGCQDFFGGVKDVYIMELENATTITAAAGIVTGITKATGKKFQKYQIEAHTGLAGSAKVSNRETGTSEVTQTINFPINGMSVSVRNEIELLAKNRLLIVIVDNNGLAWLFGKDFGMKLNTANSTTGRLLSEANRYDLTFEGKEKALELNVDATTLATLETPGA